MYEKVGFPLLGIPSQSLNPLFTYGPSLRFASLVYQVLDCAIWHSSMMHSVIAQK